MMAWLYIPLSCAPAQECSEKASGLHSNFLDGSTELSVTSKGKLLPQRSLLRSWKRNAWMQRLSGLTLLPSTAKHGGEKWIASLLDSPVRICQLLGGDQGLTESGPGFSSTSARSQMIAERDSSFWRTSVASLLPPPPLFAKPKNGKNGQFPESWENWPTAGGMRNGCMYQRQTWAQVMAGRGGSVLRGENWQTPGADSFRSRGGERKSEMGLDQQVRAHWPTPKTLTGGANSKRSQRNAGGADLQESVEQWPTPTGQDNNQVKGQAAAADNPQRGTTLGGAIRHWPTPAAHEERLGFQDRSRGKKGSQESLTTVVMLADQDPSSPLGQQTSDGPNHQAMSLPRPGD
jgi:hypothetical protein